LEPQTLWSGASGRERVSLFLRVRAEGVADLVHEHPLGVADDELQPLADDRELGYYGQVYHHGPVVIVSQR
jgi:hypothetical protein